MTETAAHTLQAVRGQGVARLLVIVLPLAAVAFLLAELALAYHARETAQRAAQFAARQAATASPVYVGEGMWRTNRVDARNGALGDACFQADGRDACIDPGGPFLCRGATAASDPDCDADRLSALLAKVQRLYPSIGAERVSIAYVYRRLGFAGGPFVPEIVVSVAPEPPPLGLAPMLGLARGGPAIASSYGEDMAG